MKQVVESLPGKSECLWAETAADALGHIEDDSFDLVLLDLNMPGLDGCGLLTAMAARGTHLPSVLVSATEDLLQIHRALELGALGYIPKALSADHMRDAISSVLDGDIFIPEHVRIALARVDRGRSEQSHGLTKRQLEVLRFVNQGQTNRQIATTLFISEDTVKFHIRALMEALGARTRTECIARAKSLGILDH